MQKIIYTEDSLQHEIKNLAYNIAIDSLKYPEPPILICVLNGAFMFYSDLLKNLKVDCEVDFIRARSYEGKKQEEIKLTKDIELNIKGRNVYLIDDIYETGNTIRFLTKHLLEKHKPANITPVTLFNRGPEFPSNLIYGIELQTTEFIAGFGLDDNGLKRNLPYIFEVEE